MNQDPQTKITLSPEIEHPAKRLMGEKQVEARYGIPVRTLQKLRWAGGSCPFVRLGRRVYYRAEDVEAWIAENLRTSTSDPGPQGA